jgi:hypothetical protein
MYGSDASTNHAGFGERKKMARFPAALRREIPAAGVTDFDRLRVYYHGRLTQ